MLTKYSDPETDGHPSSIRDFTIEWNGSATFNVQSDGVDVDCFTVYGQGTPGGPCTAQEAHDVAAKHFDELAAEAVEAEREGRVTEWDRRRHCNL